MQQYTLDTVRRLKGQIRMLALDLDGTLLNSSREVSPRNLRALRAAQKQGLYVTITTGRPPHSVLRYASLLGTARGSFAIVFNGAGVVSLDDYAQKPQEQGFDLLHRSICEAQRVQEIYLRAQSYGLSMHGYSVEQGLLVREVTPYAALEINHNQAPYQLMDFAALPCELHFFKVLVTGESERLDAFRQELDPSLLADFEIMRSTPNFLEFIPDRSSKGSALAWLCRYLGLETSQVMAFGDAENDLTMLQTAGCGVAMANALQPEILDSADLVTLSNDEDGVALAVEQILEEQ